MMNTEHNEIKIGIVSTFYALNYGAILQSFSLQQYIQEKGYECEILNFRPKTERYGRKYLMWSIGLKQCCKNLLNVLNIKNYQRMREKVRAFDDFICKRLIIGEEELSSSEMFENIDKYTCLIAGSDQIWNLNLFDIDMFFLPVQSKFPSIDCCSYAASVTEEMSNEQWNCIHNRIKHFKKVSFRENVSTEKYNSLFNENAVTMIDPVFLHDCDYWKKQIQQERIQPQSKKYILCYCLGIRGFERKIIDRIIEKEDLVVINVGEDTRNILQADKNLSYVGPMEFLSLIYNAEYVVTNSFHMTAFSIIFKKKFISVAHHNRNSRVENILRIFNLRDRIIDCKENVKEFNFDQIDYSTLDSIMKKVNTDADLFLNSCIVNMGISEKK